MAALVTRFAPSIALAMLLIACLAVPLVDGLRGRLRRWRESRAWQRDVRRAELRRAVMREYWPTRSD